MSTEPRKGSARLTWFSRPDAAGSDDPGTLNPAFEALDRPVIAGRADEIFPHAFGAGATGDPLTYADALDRVAKLAGILALLEVGPGVPVRVAAEVPEPAAELARLAVWRLGGLLEGRADAPAAVELTRRDGPEPERSVHSAFDAPLRRLSSRFEGVAIAATAQPAGEGPAGEGPAADGPTGDGPAGDPVALDSLVRDGRIEPGAAVAVRADLVIEIRGDGSERTALEAALLLAEAVAEPEHDEDDHGEHEE